MASDPSIYNLVGQGVTPLLSPLEVQIRKLQMRNALAAGTLQDQQIQQGALTIDQLQQAATDRQALRNAMTQYYGGASSPTPAGAPTAAPQVDDGSGPFSLTGAPANAAPPAPVAPPSAPVAGPVGAAGAGAPPTQGYTPVPRPAVPTMADLVQRGVNPTDASGLIQHFQTIDKNTADIDKANAEADKARKEAAGLIQQHIADMASGIVDWADKHNGQVPPELVNWHLQNFASLGPAEAQQAAGVQRMLTQLSPPDQVGFLRTLTTPKSVEANAKRTEADTSAAKETRAAADGAAAKLRSALGAATNQNDWNRILGNADPNVVTAVNPPAAFSPANQGSVVRGGQTSNEQVTSAETRRADQAREANEKRARDQEQQNINLRQRAFNQQFGNPLEGASQQELETAKMRAAGALPLPNSRTKGYDRAVALAAASDPTGTFAQYAGTRFDTIKNFKEKGDSNDLVALATALEHLDRAKENSAAMGYEPTLGTNLFPTQHRYHQDVYNLTDEVGKLIKSGVVPESEGKRAIDNLMSSFQSNRDAGLDELKNLMGGKVAAKIQKYVTGTGQLLPASMFDKPTQERLKAAGFANGIDWNATAAPSASAAPGAPAPAAPAPKTDLSKVPTADLLKALGQ